MEKKEKLVVQILATQFHTEPADESRVGKEIRLNHVMKDLIINGYVDGSYMQVGESKGNKRRRKETEDKMVVEGTGESQPAWLDTLK